MAQDEVYDQDADQFANQHHAPGAGSGSDSKSSSPGDIAQQEGLFKPGGDDGAESATAGELGSQESGAGQKNGLYKDEPAKKKKVRPGKKLSQRSNTRKRLAIAGAAAGGSLIVGIIAFFALLPLKIESLVKDLESHYFATTQNAIDKTTENEFNVFVAKEVLPNFFTRKDCVSTVDPSCVSVASGTGPVDRLFQSWRQGNLEKKLATDYGIVIGRKGTNGQLFMNLGGKTLDENQLKQIMTTGGKVSMFDLAGTTTASRNEVRSAVRDALKGATLYDKVFFRFKVGKLVETKYGVKRCVIACDTKDKFADSVANKKLAAKAYLVERVVMPFNSSAGLVLQCLMSGTCSTDDLTPSGNPDDPEKTSSFQKKLNSQLEDFAAKYGSEKLADLIKTADDISKDGLSKYLFKEVVSKVTGKEAAGDLAGSLADGAGTVNFIARIVNFVNGAGPTVKKMNYALGAAAAVQTYMTFRTVTDEVHSHHMDATELGSFNDQLSRGNVDATSTPLYNSLFGNSSTTTAFVDNLMPSADAISTTPSNGSYLCKNGKPVPKGQKVCNEEVFNGGNGLATDLTNAAKSIPGWGVLSMIASAWNATGGQLFDAFSNFLGGALQYLPGYSSLSGLISDAFQPIFNFVTNYLINTPLQDAVNANTNSPVPGGGRTFDMMAGGADTLGMKSCQVQLGCAAITPTQTAAIENEQLQQDKFAFDRQSMFARMFSTSSQYSLISRLAVAMPSNLTSASDSGLASLLGNPVNKLASLFGALLSTNHAFADNTPTADPFGVVQYGYLDSQIPADPQAYWDQNCQGDYMTNWENSQKEDDNTGEAVATTPNACMLIESSVQAAGGLDNSSLLPQGSQNP